MIKNLSASDLKDSIIRHLRITLARDLKSASKKKSGWLPVMQLETVLLIDSYELKRNMESRKHEESIT